MAQQALTLVGGAAGSYFGDGNSNYTQWGALIGGAIGGAIDASRQNSFGPRLGDLNVQISTYGVMRPRIWGTWAAAGNVIWCTNLREVESSSGGKGGPKTTTYNYNVDIAILICRGPMINIRKCWSNGKLIYDASSGGDAATIIASTLKAKTFKFYQGTDDQQPDPTIEAIEGAGNVPAYLDSCYVVFGELDCPNGMIPQLKFEVMQYASFGPETTILCRPPHLGIYDGGVVRDKEVWHFGEEGSNEGTNVYRGGSDYVVSAQLIGWQEGILGPQKPIPVVGRGDPQAWRMSYLHPDIIRVVHEVANLKSGKVAKIGDPDIAYSTNDHFSLRVAYDSETKSYVGVSDQQAGFSTSQRPMIFRGDGSEEFGEPVPSGYLGPVFFQNTVIYVINYRSDVPWLVTYSASSMLITAEYEGPEAIGFVSRDGSNIWVSETGVVYLLLSASAGHRYVYKITEGVWEELARDVLLDPNTTQGSIISATIYCNDDYLVVGPTGENGTPEKRNYNVIALNAATPQNVPLADIITDICLDSGLTEDQIDVTLIDQTVKGYGLSRVATGRSSIEPLLQGFSIDAPEIDGKIRFKPRALATVVAEISFDELASIEGGGSAEDPFPLSRQQPDELPRRVTVNYIDASRDYDTGSESAVRRTVASVNDVVLEFPVSTTGDHAASIANVWLFDAWNARNRRTIKILRKFAGLDAADWVRVEYPRDTRQVMRLVRVTDTGALIECEAEPADGTLYTTTAVGTSSPNMQTVDQPVAPTAEVLLDTSILRDEDNDAGFYRAEDGLGTGWRGAALYSGLTDSDLEKVFDVSRQTETGLSNTVMGLWPYNFPDEFTELIVQISQDATFSSITHEQLLTTANNTFAIGQHGRWEICRFREAVEVEEGVWRFTGLLRGLRGTEHAIPLHEINDRFVVLQVPGIVREGMTLANLNQPMKYRAISHGQQLSDEVSQTFSNTGEGLRPFAPTDLRIDDHGSYVDVYANRRTRLTENWLAGMVPLGEESESYEIDIESPTGTISTFEANSLPATIEVGTYQPAGLGATGGGADFAVLEGDYVYAVQDSGSSSQFQKLDATTLAMVAQISAGPECWKMVFDGTYFWTCDVGASPTKGKLRKFDAAATLVSSVDLDTPGDGQGLAYCGGDMWVSCPYSYLVRRVNTTTLGTMVDITVGSVSVGGPNSLATDGTYVYAVSRGASRCYVIRPSDNTVFNSFAVSSFPMDCCIAGGLLWVAGSYDQSLTCYDLATGMPQGFTLSMAGESYSQPFGYLSTDGDYVLAGRNFLQVVDANAKKLIANVTLDIEPGDMPAASLITKDRLIVTDGDNNLDYYDRVTLASGSTIRLYQMSASVGRGHPAVLEIA